MDDDGAVPEEESEWESGPFCRHYGSLGDCDDLCGKCNHSCNVHRDEVSCDEANCECDGWVDVE